MIGRTMEPYFLPLGENDVFMYDHLVFPEYRGRRMLSLLMISEIGQLATESRSRAYFEVAEWNHACISSVTEHRVLPRYRSQSDRVRPALRTVECFRTTLATTLRRSPSDWDHASAVRQN